MKRTVLAGLMLLAACTPAQEKKAVVDGQLFCAKAQVVGPVVVPLVVAATTAFGVPISVIGLGAKTVTDMCTSIGAIPVSPPADPAGAPVVALPLTPAKPAI